MALLLVLASFATLQMPDGRLHVHSLDVGQGDAILIQCPNGQQILVDGGPSPSALLSHLGWRIPFWDNSLDLVILTHLDVDHVEDLVDLLGRYEVGLVMDSGQACTNAACQAWRSMIEEKEIPYRVAEAGTQLNVGEHLPLEVLHPPAQFSTNTASDMNNNLVVPRLRYGRFSLLLAVDVQEEAEKSLPLSGQPLDALVLKVLHHSGADSSTPPFLKAVNRELAIVSVGANNRLGHPQEITLKKLERILTYCTNGHGSVAVESDGAICRMPPESRRYARPREAEQYRESTSCRGRLDRAQIAIRPRLEQTV
jgi:competence protein ComEC